MPGALPRRLQTPRPADPADADPTGEWYTFEKGVDKDTGGQGFADVWRRGFFGWEYKGKRKNLADAYRQLSQYREALANPPLLIVCDLNRFEIHTNFTGTVKEVHAFDLDGQNSCTSRRPNYLHDRLSPVLSPSISHDIMKQHLLYDMAHYNIT